MLTKDQLRCIVSIMVNIALILIPLYASDFPSSDKRTYYKLLLQWTKRSQAVIDNLLSEFKGGPGSKNMSGRISMQNFIDTAKRLNLYDVLSVRELAKVTQVITDLNPSVNREDLLEKDLFGDRKSNEPVLKEQEIEEDLVDLP